MDSLLEDFNCADVVVQKLSHLHDGQELTGFVASPRRSTHPSHHCVLVAHTAIGPQESFILEKASKLAKLGYVSFAVDLFGAGHLVFGDEKVEHNSRLKEDRRLLQSRMVSALEASLSIPNVTGQVAAIGYCFGGTAVLDLCRARPPGLFRGAVSLHGILDGGEKLDSVSLEGGPKILALNGSSDPYVTQADKAAFTAEMESKNARWRLHDFAECMHAFTRPDKTKEEDRRMGLYYDEDAATRSWEMVEAFLSEVFTRQE